MLRKFVLALTATLLLLFTGGVAAAATFDVSDGLFANIPPGGTGGMETQTGADNWWYKYDPTARFGQQGSPITRDPSTFVLMELGRDGTTGTYGWAANAGVSVNDRGVFRNGDVAGRSQQGGTSQGTGVWANSENGVQLALEWRAPSAGTADVNFDFVGRDHADADMEWHLAHWDGATWSNLGFTLVTQADTPAMPDNLSATGLALDAGDSIYLYGQIADHDAFDGTVFSGAVDFTPNVVPEPSSLALCGLAGFAVAGFFLLRRRSKK